VALVLLAAGHETTANMLGLGAFALLENPDQLAALRAGPNLLLDGAIDELLRYLSIVQMAVSRVATEDVTIAAVAIRRSPPNRSRCATRCSSSACTPCP
jgi:cytochrome P450